MTWEKRFHTDTQTYEDYPHVPFPCLCDGLRFVTMTNRRTEQIDDPVAADPVSAVLLAMALTRPAR